MGQTAYVDDGRCPAGQVKQFIGGDAEEYPKAPGGVCAASPAHDVIFTA